MAFKMKKPSIIQGTSVHKNAIKLNREMDRTNVADGRAGSSAFQKKDFGMEESGMKFRKIGSKIREKLAARKRNKAADDPDFKRRDDESHADYKARKQEIRKETAKKISEGTREEKADKSGRKQDIAQTGVTEAKRTGKKVKEFATDKEGNVTMSKVKTRGGKVVTKIVDAEGKKTKTVENLRRKKKLEKKLKDLDPTNMAVEGTKLGKKKAKLEKKIAKTTKEKRPTTRRAAGETVQGKRHSQTVADARKRLTKQFEEKTQKPIKEFNKKELDAYNKELAELKKQDYKVVDREEGKGITMRSPMKADDDGTTVKTTKLVKKGKTTTETTPGETKTTPSGSAEFNKAYAKACASGAKTFMFKGREILCKQAPEKKETKPTTKTTTTPDKEETLTLKQKKVPTLEFGEGKFNTLKVTDKKKSPRGKKRGKNRKKISLKNLFRRDSKGNKIACGANFAE